MKNIYSQEKYIDPFLNALNCYQCGNLNTKSTKLKNVDNLNALDLTKSIEHYLDNFELEFIHYGQLKQKKGRKKWTKHYEKVLQCCLKLFGWDYNLIKIFIPKVSEKIIRYKIHKLESKKYIKPSNNFSSKHDLNILNESITKFKNINNLNNNNFKEFSLDNYLFNQKLQDMKEKEKENDNLNMEINKIFKDSVYKNSENKYDIDDLLDENSIHSIKFLD